MVRHRLREGENEVGAMKGLCARLLASEGAKQGMTARWVSGELMPRGTFGGGNV